MRVNTLTVRVCRGGLALLALQGPNPETDVVGVVQLTM
jgi:hypothetical protein